MNKTSLLSANENCVWFFAAPADVAAAAFKLNKFQINFYLFVWPKWNSISNRAQRSISANKQTNLLQQRKQKQQQ